MVQDSPITYRSAFEAENTMIEALMNLGTKSFRNKETQLRFHALAGFLRQLYHLGRVCPVQFLKKLIPEPYTYTFCMLKEVTQAATAYGLSQG